MGPYPVKGCGKYEGAKFGEVGSKPERFVDTQFCTHNLILKDDYNDHSNYLKNQNCISCIKSFIPYHKIDLEILMIVMICPVPKSNC